MAETADSLNRDQIAGDGSAVAQRVERGDARAQKRRRVRRIERIGNPRQRLYRGYHVLFIASVEVYAGHLRIGTVRKISAAARQARAVLPGMPAHAYTVALFPVRDAGAECVDHARDFMSWDSRIGEAGPPTFLGEHIAVAYATCLDADSHLPGPWLRNFPLDDLEFSPGVRHLNDLHLRHVLSFSIRCEL
jgi:hypothetical protein